MRFVYALMLTATAALGCSKDDDPDTCTLVGPSTATSSATGTPSLATSGSMNGSASATNVASGLAGSSAPATGSSSASAPTDSMAIEPAPSPSASATDAPTLPSTSESPALSSPAPDVPPSNSESAGAGGSAELESDAGDGSEEAGGTSNPPDMSEPDESTNDVDAGGEPAAGECPHSGNVTYHFNGSESWPSQVVERLTAALDEGTWYYNCYSDLEKSITINYRPGVPTAEGNVDGVISFGDDLGYMQTATAMHEIAHTLGVAYYPWTELIVDGRWTGAAVDEVIENLPAEERDPDMYSQRTYITCDSQHFWPYGLQTASEHQSEWSLINNVRIVAAMNVDKQNYIDTH